MAAPPCRARPRVIEVPDSRVRLGRNASFLVREPRSANLPEPPSSDGGPEAYADSSHNSRTLVLSLARPCGGIASFMKEASHRGASRFRQVFVSGQGIRPGWSLAVFFTLYSILTIVAALSLKRTGALWFVIGLHAAFDWANAFFYSLSIAGLTARGHLMKASLAGPAWITGGNSGPVESVFAFLVIALAGVIIHFVFPAAKSPGEPDGHPVAIGIRRPIE